MNNIIYLATFVLLLLSSCTKQQHYTYRVALSALPNSFDPYKNNINDYHYINQHLYYPLFSEDNGQLISQFLDMNRTKSTDASFQAYKFCLKDNIHFSDNSLITTEDLIASLKKTHNEIETLEKIKEIKSLDSHCTKIQLEQPDNEYMHKLTTIHSTITSSNSNPSNYIGLGPFHLTSNNSNKIILKRSENSIEGNIQTIEFIDPKFISEKEASLINDWNQVPNIKIKNIKDFKAYDVPVLKSYFIIVNFPDKELRDSIFNCFDRDKFVSLTKLPLLKIAGFLPKGAFGHNINITQNIMNDDKCNKGNELTFIAFRENLLPAIKSFFTGSKTTVKFITPNEAILLVKEKKLTYALMGIDSSRHQTQSFFNVFYGSKKIIHKDIVGLESLITKASREKNTKIKDQLFKKAHKLVLDSHYIIPLGQFKAIHYYPKGLKNIEFSSVFSNQPRIEKMSF